MRSALGEEASLDENSWAILFSRGLALLHLQRDAEALSYFDRASLLDSGPIELLSARASALARK